MSNIIPRNIPEHVRVARNLRGDADWQRQRAQALDDEARVLRDRAADLRAAADNCRAMAHTLDDQAQAILRAADADVAGGAR